MSEKWIRQIKERIAELEEALEAHGVCSCDLCVERQEELVGLYDQLETHEREEE